MDNRILLGGAAVLVVGAAFGGGYYISHQSAPPLAPPAAQSLPQTEAPPPEQASAPIASPPASQPAPAQQVVATAPVKKKRLPDYANGETAYGPPPPPPPPPRDFGNRPNPFEGRFSTFPMHHNGAGTLGSPLTWTAQTDFGNGREADLRVSVVVPMPSPDDRGVFWSKWGARGGDDVMPDVTRGTPVVVAASASVVVAIDPELLDLDAPAILSVNGRDGQRVYRSRDVAPARGESWNAQGARWIFQPDADFFRMMRDGANVSVMLRSRMSEKPIAVPFSTDDFPPSLNGFERDLHARMPGIAAAWDRARPGVPPSPPRQAHNPLPPPQAGNPPQGLPPRPNPPFEGTGYPPPRGPAPSQHGPQPESPQPAASGPQPSPESGNGYGHGAGGHGHDHGASNVTTPPQQTAKSNTPPAAQPAPAKPASSSSAPAHRAVTPPPTPAKSAPLSAPAKPATSPSSVVAPAPRAAATNPGAAMTTAEVAAYRPPTENCGPQPPVPQTRGSSPERKQSNIWLKCRGQWLAMYKQSVNVLARDAKRAGTPLPAVDGGGAVVNAFQKAQGEFNAQKAVIKP